MNVVKVGYDFGSSENDQYDYFINNRKQEDKFKVKVKNVETFQEVYKPEIDAFLEEYGFSSYEIPHSSSCKYAEPPTGSED